MFPWASTAREILEAHTPFTFFASVTSAAVAAAWISKFEGGGKTPICHLTSSRAGHVFTTATLRWCPHCVAEQQGTLGAGVWRYMAQIEGLEACDLHGVRLESGCRRCGQPKRVRGVFPLPSDPCAKCGLPVPGPDSSLPASSEGARKLAIACGQIDSRGCPDFEPFKWAAHVRWAIAKIGTREKLQELLLMRLAEDWQLDLHSPCEKEKSLSDFLRMELYLLGRAVDILPKVSMLTALRELHLLLPEGQEHASQQDENEYELERALVANQKPVGIAPVVLGHMTADELIAASGIARESLRHHLKVRGKLSKEIAVKPIRKTVTFSPEQDEARRAYYRARVLEVIKSDGPQSRQEIRGRLFDQVDWLIKNDSEWMDRVVPTLRPDRIRPSQSDAEKRAIYRKRVLALIAAGVRFRAAIQANDPRAFSWLSANDTAWFEQHCVRFRIPNHASDEVRRKESRARLLALKDRGLKTRMQIWRAARYFVQWISKNDKDWLNKHFPLD